MKTELQKRTNVPFALDTNTNKHTNKHRKSLQQQGKSFLYRYEFSQYLFNNLSNLTFSMSNNETKNQAHHDLKSIMWAQRDEIGSERKGVQRNTPKHFTNNLRWVYHYGLQIQTAYILSHGATDFLTTCAVYIKALHAFTIIREINFVFSLQNGKHRHEDRNSLWNHIPFFLEIDFQERTSYC